jgi:hypothetical protein
MMALGLISHTDAHDKELEVEKLEGQLILDSEDERLDRKKKIIPVNSEDPEIEDLAGLSPFYISHNIIIKRATDI